MKIIITGPPGSGKTTFCQSYIREWQKLGYRVGGLLCTEVRRDGHRIGSDAQDLLSGQRVPMTRIAGCVPLKGYAVGKYIISFEGVRFGKKTLGKVLAEKCDFVVIDEVGPLELRGDGLAEPVGDCISSVQNLAIVVRSSMLDTFLDCFGRGFFQDALIVDAALSDSLYSTSHLPTMEKRNACFRKAELPEGPEGVRLQPVDTTSAMGAAGRVGWTTASPERVSII